MFATPASTLSGFATLLAVLILIFAFAQVGSMRGKHKIAAPAMTGHPEFERAVRVHMNTIEQFAIFLPLLWLATLFFHLIGWLPAVLGLVWCIGRLIYSIGYMADAERRHVGFLVSGLSSVALLIISVYGLIATWMALSAT